jgi:DNA helicase-2/ATP-dependent DNA helicase PcrA
LERLFRTPFARQTKIEIATLRSKDRNGRIDREKFEQQLQRVEERWGILAQLAAGYREVPSFLTSVALGANEIAEGEGVNLLTIHASKGLEFKEVYLIDLMEGRFPNTRLANSGAGLEEERRLFYVAVTRAKDRLTLSMAYQDWKGKVYKPSRFLEEAGYKVKKI